MSTTEEDRRAALRIYAFLGSPWYERAARRLQLLGWQVSERPGHPACRLADAMDHLETWSRNRRADRAERSGGAPPSWKRRMAAGARRAERRGDL